VIYAVFGLLSLYNAYLILVKRSFVMVTGFEERLRRNIKNERLFAIDHAIPHIIIGLSFVAAFIIFLVYGYKTLLYTAFGNMLCFGYGVFVAKRMPARIRRGRYK
jgi:hypothetical protein